MLTRFIDKLKCNSHYKVKTFLLLSLIINLLYSLYLLAISNIYYSSWFLVMGIYYFALSLIRVFVYFQLNDKRKFKTKIIAIMIIGYYLLIINLILSTMMFILIYKTEFIKYHEITVIALATYTFASLTIAIISWIKYVRIKDYSIISAKIISLISASVSIVTLTNTMLNTWGENNDLLRSIIMPILCVIVSLYVVFTAILLIYKANKKLRTLNNEKTRR